MEDEPTTEIPEAMSRALCEHGYANLTLQDIAAETDKGKASIHSHYDSKDRLFVALLDLLYERYTERVDSPVDDTPRERLGSLLEVLLTNDADTSWREFRTAMLEVKAQAPYDATIRDRLVEFDEFPFERLREILETGVNAGDFDASIDPSPAAEFLTTTITGARTRQVAVDHSPERLYTTTTRCVGTHLLDDEPMEATH